MIFNNNFVYINFFIIVGYGDLSEEFNIDDNGNQIYVLYKILYIILGNCNNMILVEVRYYFIY